MGPTGQKGTQWEENWPGNLEGIEASRYVHVRAWENNSGYQWLKAIWTPTSLRTGSRRRRRKEKVMPKVGGPSMTFAPPW